MLASRGVERARIAELLNVQAREVADKLGRLRRELDCTNDVQLGWTATRLGLLDDDVDELAALEPDP